MKRLCSCGELVQARARCSCGARSPGPPFVAAVLVLAAYLPELEDGVIVGDTREELEAAELRRAT